MFSKSLLIVSICLVQLNNFNAAELKSGSSYIVGGSTAKVGSIPYFAALSVLDTSSGQRLYACGAALVTTRSIITAGHCLDPIYNSTGGYQSPYTALQATVGTIRWYIGGQSYDISHNLTHPKHNGNEYDLSFLYTTKCVILSHLVKTVPFNFEYVDTGAPAKVSGFGWTEYNENATVSSTLQEVALTTVDKDFCLEKLLSDSPNNTLYFDMELCAFNSTGHGTCVGDSGSPLIRTDIEHYGLIGCVSSGVPCAVGIPDVYTRFSAFQEWITANMIDDCPAQTTRSAVKTTTTEMAAKTDDATKKYSGLLGHAKNIREKVKKFFKWQ